MILRPVRAPQAVHRLRDLGGDPALGRGDVVEAHPAINTDPGANLVTKADYAVIGDLHEVVPAISAEIRRRQ